MNRYIFPHIASLIEFDDLINRLTHTPSEDTQNQISNQKSFHFVSFRGCGINHMYGREGKSEILWQRQDR